jgi:hypothetical protein
MTDATESGSRVLAAEAAIRAGRLPKAKAERKRKLVPLLPDEARRIAKGWAHIFREGGFEVWFAMLFAVVTSRGSGAVEVRQCAVVYTKGKDGARGELRIPLDGSEYVRLGHIPMYRCPYCEGWHGPRQVIAGPRPLRVWACNAERFVLGLVLKFHVLEQAEGLAPWNAKKFARWARTGYRTPSTFAAAAFVLNVWNNAWAKSGFRFSVVDAMGRWDDRNRAAFVEWAQRPWWP